MCRSTCDVTGIFRATDPTDIAWHVAPRLLEPQLIGGSAAVAVVALMVSDTSMPYALVATFPQGMTRTYTYTVVPSALDAANASQVEVQARGLASGKQVFATLGSDVRVTTRLDGVLHDASTRIDAAAAQASVLLIGVLAVMVAVILLAAQLVAQRRSVALAQVRARGGSLAAIGVAAAAESIPLAAVGGMVGAGAAWLALHGETPWAWLAPPLVIAACTPPILAARVASRRADRRGAPLHRRLGLTAAKVRRFAGETLLVVTALGALATLKVRGVGASAGSIWSDIAVLAAPVLVALAMVVVLLRAQPRIVRAARSSATRLRGAVALLAAARAHASGMSAAALVLATAVTALSASLALTVSEARAAAAWDAVGAQVAVTTDDPRGLPNTIAALEGERGLAVAEASRVSNLQVIGAKVDDRVDVILVDAGAMSQVLTVGSPTAWADADALLSTARTDGAVPVLVAGGRSDWQGAALRWGEESIPVEPVGITPMLPPQLASRATVVVVDRAAFEAAGGQRVPATVAWVTGPAAGEDVATAVADAHAEQTTHVVTREGWLAERSGFPIARALDWLFVMATTVGVVMSVLAVILMAASGSPDRLRSIARARVVGLPRRAAHRVAWLEVAMPVVAWSLVGVAVGLGLVHVLVVPLNLQSLTGGRGEPPALTPWWPFALAGALGIVAWVSVALASRARGGERLGALMRVS